MPLEQFENFNFRQKAIVRIQQANEIIAEYDRQGFTLTLRQLYYQFVARDLIANTQAEYKKLGKLISNARLAGLIDWLSIEDRTRNLKSASHWDSPESLVDTCSRQFRVDLWEGQAYRPEVWIEKEALVGVIEPICDELDVSFFACRGYVSQSEQWRAGRRILTRGESEQQETIILHLGDHDPSGIDMTRDNTERLTMFAEMGVQVKRLALNMDQIEQYSPPPNFAKPSDSRFASYRENYGEESWELDALEPRVIAELIENAIRDLIDPDPWERQEELQAEGRLRLEHVAAGMRLSDEES